jgi:hypothetical protein
MDFMLWLNLNSGTIQALGSLAIAVLSVALVLITWPMSSLHRRTFDSRGKLLGQHLEAAAAPRMELRTQTDLLLSRAFWERSPRKTISAWQMRSRTVTTSNHFHMIGFALLRQR